MAKGRCYTTEREIGAGCFTCSGLNAKWIGVNAQAVAARHHDLTGHMTWVDIRMKIYYGKSAESKIELQTKLI